MRAHPVPCLVGAAVLVTGLTAPAAAQFEAELPPTEDQDAIDIAVTPDGQEWWVAETDGQVATAPLGDPQVTCPPPGDVPGYVRSIARTPSGEGYWLTTTYGQVIPCGDAEHVGDLPAQGITPDEPVVGIAATPDGNGYWLVASDGGVFSFGSAVFRGSAADIDLDAPIVGMAAAEGGGYWLVAADGGVFTFGDAGFYGSGRDIAMDSPVTAISRTSGGGGYHLLGEDGGVFSFGDAGFHGSRYTLPDSASLTDPFVGIEAAWGRDGYFITDTAGVVQSFIGDDDGGSDSDEIVTSPGFPGTGPAAYLTDVDLAGHEAMDRFVLEFGDQLPEYSVRYVDAPILEQPSAMPVEVAGQAFVEITAAPASGVDLTGDEPRETYPGPDRVTAPGTEVVTEAVATEDFENHLTWVVGLEERTDVEVSTLQDPARIVVDVQHPAASPGDPARCENPEGFSVVPPAGWATNDGDVVPPCSMWDPEPFDVPEGTDARVAAITAYVDPVPYAEVATPERVSDLDRAVTTVDGRQAVRLSYEQDEGLYPAGTPITSYAVDLTTVDGESQTLVLNTVGLDQVDYPSAVAELDRMFGTLDITAQGVDVDPAVVASYLGGGGGFSVTADAVDGQVCLRIPPEGVASCVDAPAEDGAGTAALQDLQGDVLAGAAGSEVWRVDAEEQDGSVHSFLPADVPDSALGGFAFPVDPDDVSGLVLRDISGQEVGTATP